MTTAQKLLELAYDQAQARIADFSPGDLNALIKTLSAIKKEEEPEKPAASLGGFIAKHTANK
jgi:hypothetical protein